MRIVVVGGGTGGATFAGTVARLTYIGDVLVYDIEASGLALKVESATDGHTQRFSVGDKVMCEWLPKDMQVFREAA